MYFLLKMVDAIPASYVCLPEGSAPNQHFPSKVLAKAAEFQNQKTIHLWVPATRIVQGHTIFDLKTEDTDICGDMYI